MKNLTIKKILTIKKSGSQKSDGLLKACKIQLYVLKLNWLYKNEKQKLKSYKRIEKLSSLSRRIGDLRMTLELSLLGGCVAIPYPTWTFLGGCHPISRPLIATCSWFILLVDWVKSHRRWILIFLENSAETLLLPDPDNVSKSAWLDLSLEVLFGAFCSKIRLLVWRFWLFNLFTSASSSAIRLCWASNLSSICFLEGFNFLKIFSNFLTIIFDFDEFSDFSEDRLIPVIAKVEPLFLVEFVILVMFWCLGTEFHRLYIP